MVSFKALPMIDIDDGDDIGSGFRQVYQVSFVAADANMISSQRHSKSVQVLAMEQGQGPQSMHTSPAERRTMSGPIVDNLLPHSSTSLAAPQFLLLTAYLVHV